jgi:hypothetical protein
VSQPRKGSCGCCGRVVSLKKGTSNLAFHRAPGCELACSGGKIGKAERREEQGTHPVDCRCARVGPTSPLASSRATA